MKNISEMTDDELEAMLDEEYKEDERKTKIIERFITELFPGQVMVSYEYNFLKGMIKIGFKKKEYLEKTLPLK